MADQIYYDLVATGTSNTTHSFLTHTEKSDGKTTTNLTEANKLDKDFVLKRLELIPASDIDTTDALKLFEKAVIEIKIDNQRLFIGPAALCLTDAFVGFGSNGGLTSGNTDQTGVHSTMNGYAFDEPITIPANTKLEVDLICGSAFSTDTNLTVCLEGSA